MITVLKCLDASIVDHLYDLSNFVILVLALSQNCDVESSVHVLCCVGQCSCCISVREKRREEDAFDGHWQLLGYRFGQFFSINRSLVIALFRIAQV